MQLTEGYKQTEVGSIPEDWDCYSVGSMIHSGLLEKPLDGNHGNIHPTSGDFVDHGIPFVMANNVQNGRVDLENCSFIRKEQADSLQKGFAITGDVLLTHKATIGNTAIVGDIPYPYIMLTPQVTYYRVSDISSLSNLYLRHYFDSFAFQEVLKIKAGGGTRSYIGIKAQHQLPVALPPTKAEQEAIAEALSDTDAWIESLEQLIAKKRRIKAGSMQALLKPKEDWTEKTLKNTATLKARIGWQGLTTAEYLDSGEFHLVTGTDFKNGFIDWDHCAYVDQSRFKQDKNIQLKMHDVLVTKDGTIGKVALINELHLPATLNSGVFVIRPVGDSFNPEFFYYPLCSEVFIEFLGHLSAGSTINHLYQKDFATFIYKTHNLELEEPNIAKFVRHFNLALEALAATETDEKSKMEIARSIEELKSFKSDWTQFKAKGLGSSLQAFRNAIEVH